MVSRHPLCPTLQCDVLAISCARTPYVRSTAAPVIAPWSCPTELTTMFKNATVKIPSYMLTEFAAGFETQGAQCVDALQGRHNSPSGRIHTRNTVREWRLGSTQTDALPYRALKPRRCLAGKRVQVGQIIEFSVHFLAYQPKHMTAHSCMKRRTRSGNSYRLTFYPQR